ncbi:MAG: hypothetical protein ABH841_02735 [Candidatus Nealsonbacteria bacterium]
MTNEAEIQKLEEEYPDVFKNIPDDIAEAILSDETSLKISGICLNNGVEDEAKIEKASYLITLTLLGKLPTEELNTAMEKELGTSQDVARKIQDEINKNVFFQIKDSLKKLYKKDLLKEETTEQKQKRTSGKDTYREIIG